MSQKLFCDPVAGLLVFRAYNHGLKGLQKPKTYCDNSSLPIFHLLSLLLGRELCGDRILRSCLQKGPATTPANYAQNWSLQKPSHGINRIFKLFKNKKSAQRVSFWDGYPADIRGSFARISRPKTSVRALKIPEKQAFGRGHPWPKGADVHDPNGLPKTSVRKTLG